MTSAPPSLFGPYGPLVWAGLVVLLPGWVPQEDKPERPPGLGVRVVAFSPDGKLLAAGTGEPDEQGRLTGWELPGGRVRYTLTESAGIPGLAFSPDGRTLAVAVYDRSAKLLDAATGQVKRTLPHPKEVRSVAFSPDGKFLASACWDRTIRLWDPESGEEKQSLTPSQPSPDSGEGRVGDRIYSVTFSPDGHKLVSAGADAVRLWELATGEAKHTWKHGSFLNRCAVFSSDGRWVITGGWDGTVRLWNVETGEMRARFQNLGGVDGVALAPATGTLAVCGIGNNVQIFGLRLDEPTAKEKERIQTLLNELDDDRYEVREAASQELFQMGFPAEPDLRRAAKESPSAEVRIRSRRVRADMLSRSAGTLAGHSRAIEAVAFSPDGKLLASGGKDGAIRLWDVANRTELARFAPDQPKK